jgi:uncharacterized membrane protein YphA (DoxX/SURF4 family)
MNTLNRIESFFASKSFISTYALRFGIGFVFMWFGWSGITDTAKWIGLVPEWTSFIASPERLVLLHGIFELVAGLLLFAGIMTRTVAALLAIDMLHIILLVSGATQIRDIGIEAALIALATHKK